MRHCSKRKRAGLPGSVARRKGEALRQYGEKRVGLKVSLERRQDGVLRPCSERKRPGLPGSVARSGWGLKVV